VFQDGWIIILFTIQIEVFIDRERISKTIANKDLIKNLDLNEGLLLDQIKPKMVQFFG